MINEKCRWYDRVPSDEGMEDYCIMLSKVLEDCGDCKGDEKEIVTERKYLPLNEFADRYLI